MGLLNSCPGGSAKETFKLASDFGGFNAWRFVNQDVQKSWGTRLAQSRRAVRNPPAVAQAWADFDAIRNAYEEGGGTAQGDQGKKPNLLESMPKEIRQQLQWRMDLPERYEEFRDMLTSTVDNINYHDDLKGSSGIYAVEPEVRPGVRCEPCWPAHDFE